MKPLEGLTVVEVAIGASDLGLGLAGAVPGMLLAELGAEVVRVVGTEQPGIDAHVPWSRPWHRHKRIVRTDDPAEVLELLRTADVALDYGAGPGYDAVAEVNPGIVYAWCEDGCSYGLLVEARSGFCSQLEGHRPGPIFVDVRATGSGTAFLLTSSVLALLRRRALTGRGGWAETSMYDGMLATLGCMIGRSERAAPAIEGYWEKGSTFPNFLYRCADGELIQVWFGGKGMYDKLLEVLGDEPSEEGYYADQMAGRLGERKQRWVGFFAQRPRDEWIERIRAVGVACEPVYSPGEVLAEEQALAVGLAVRDGADVVVGSPITVTPGSGRYESKVDPNRPHLGLLDGLKVVDFSAFVAGPLGAQVLADLGADVIKVEPPTGEAMRAAAYAIAACQRGKRSLALDIGAEEAKPVVARLLEHADVVLHNFRVGVAERLGIGPDDLAAVRPDAVFCHASGFGPSGPRAKSPGNDALMQALTGFERAVGGEGNEPIAGTWIPIDMTGGWVAACGMLAGLYARATTGLGQRVDTSLLGAGMLLQSGTYLHDGEVVAGPRLDGDQTGYGPGYRIYEVADGEWLALVVPDASAWARLRALVPALPEAYAPLRDVPGADEAEAALAAAFRSAPAAEWVSRLRSADVLVEAVVAVDRDAFRRGILDDPLNRELGRVVAYETADWGHFEQIGPLLRCGPEAGAGPTLQLPGIGEHSVEVLTELGFDREAIDRLLDAKVVAGA